MSRLRQARGPARPRYLDATGADRAVLMVLALGAEVAALRDRLDTHERLAAAGQAASRETVEAFEASEAVNASRAEERRRMIDRLTRVLLDELMPPGQTTAGTACATDSHDAG